MTSRSMENGEGGGIDLESEQQLTAGKDVGEDVGGSASSDDESASSSSSSNEEDDDLILEGVLVRNPDVESSSSDEEEEQEEQPAAKRQKKTNVARREREPEIVQVDFTFCDMAVKFFHGIKTLLHSSSTMYAPDSSALSDLMIENVSIGTVISTEEADNNNDNEDEANVYGFASVLNIARHKSHASIQRITQHCLEKCPPEHKEEMETVLSGRTKRPAGFLLHARMVNLPLEVVNVLHQQLVLDMDWAVENAQGGVDERKSLDFGALVRLAPATTTTSASPSGTVDYKYFDDEVFATNAEFVYTMDAPKQLGSEERQLCQVIVMTKTGHRQAMKELAELVSATGA